MPAGSCRRNRPGSSPSSPTEWSITCWIERAARKSASAASRPRHCHPMAARSSLPGKQPWEATMKKRSKSNDLQLRSASTLSSLAGILLATTGVNAAEVTFERLRNPEPQNWLMNHHDFSSHRYSKLDAINKTNVKNLHLAFAFAVGGNSGTENLEATPLVDDGFMYMTDAWGVVYKVDVRSGTRAEI